MRIGFISDLHYDLSASYRKDDFLSALTDLAHSEKLSMLVIGGDISNHYTTTIEFVEDLADQAGVAVYFVPGNHDYWNLPEEAVDTWQSYQAFQDHPQCLIGQVIEIDNQTALVGHSFWYNHAIYSDEFSEEMIEQGQYQGRTWQDKLRVDWGKSDRDISRYFADEVMGLLSKKTYSNYYLVSHMVTIPEFHVPDRGDVFTFFNAFIGTDDLQGLHNQYPISHSFMGHVHYRGQVQKENTLYICNCLGYEKEWPPNTDLKENLQQALYILEHPA